MNIEKLNPEAILILQDLLSYSAVSDDKQQKYFWEDFPLSLPQYVIGFFTGLGMTLFCSAASKLELGLTQPYPVPEYRNPFQDHLDKTSPKALSSGEYMKPLVSEEVNLEMEVLPDAEENRERFLSEEKGGEKFRQFDMVNDCSDHFFYGESSQVRHRT